jgi:hypothetical protein
MSKGLRTLMWLTDIGFILYWLTIFTGILPEEYRYKDYSNEMMVDWNLSFLPLDLFISLTGLLSLYYYRRQKAEAPWLCLISLSLTFCSGLQAIAFWAIRGDVDLMWWVPNLFLMVYPLFFIPRLLKKGALA